LSTHASLYLIYKYEPANIMVEWVAFLLHV
jgi:hypothetical protein